MLKRTLLPITIFISLIVGVDQFGQSKALALQEVNNASESNASDADLTQTSTEQESEIQRLKQRVAELESTQESLKAVLFKTVKLQQQQAQRRYQEVLAEYQNSERLQLQGILTVYQLDLDRFEMERARLEWQLTAAGFRAPELAAQLDLIESQRRLRIAEQQLLDSKLKLAKGYLGPKLYERYQEMLEKRKEEVGLQEQRLKAVQEMLNSSEDGRKQNPPDDSEVADGDERSDRR